MRDRARSVLVADPEERSGVERFFVWTARGLGIGLRRAVDAMGRPRRAIAEALERRRLRKSSEEDADHGAGHARARAGRSRSGSRRADRRRAIEDDLRFDAAGAADQEGLDALAEALADPDPAVRMLALDVVCDLSKERATLLLTGLLHDPEPRVRCAAAAAAARLGASSVVFSLILALDDPEHDVRTASASAIEEITGKQIPLQGTEDPATRRRKVDELKTWWKDQRVAELAASGDGDLAA